MLPAPETPVLPFPNTRANDTSSLAGYVSDLVRQLTYLLGAISRRANYGLNLDGSQTMIGPVGLQNVLFVDLPTTGHIPGQVLYVSNGRKVGEGAGLGTGVPVYWSNGQWRVFSTDAAVGV
jgi:hypothetical protein